MKKKSPLPPSAQTMKKYFDRSKAKRYHTGRMNELLLSKLVAEIKKKPTYENIFHFVNCLDFFYSTGLKYTDKSVQTKTKITLLLKENWSKGLLLKDVARKKVDVEKVQQLREKIKRTCSPAKTDYYSFVTKVFHNLNSSYFIWDRNICRFLMVHKQCSNNMKNKSYEEFYLLMEKVKGTIKWKRSNDDLDLAIWMIVDNRKLYGIKKDKRK